MDNPYLGSLRTENVKKVSVKKKNLILNLELNKISRPEGTFHKGKRLPASERHLVYFQ